MEGQALSISKGGVFSQNPCPDPNPPSAKKKRNLPGTPDPDAEVIALSPKTLLATNRFLCEMCGKGFQRDQNLQLHRRGHNLPWKLRQRSSKELIRKRVYVCPEKSCVHHHPSRALGDLTGIKKHFCRKHGEKKWKCDKCDKKYAVQSDMKAHSKTCGTREYRCDCGTVFSRRDRFITHRAFCDALAEETARISAASSIHNLASFNNFNYHPLINAGPALMRPNILQHFSAPFDHDNQLPDRAIPGLSLWPGHSPHEQFDSSLLTDPFQSLSDAQQLECQLNFLYGNKNTSSSKEVDRSNSLSKSIPSLLSGQDQRHDPLLAPDMSATALLQKAAQIGVTASVPVFLRGFDVEQQNCQSQDRSKFDGLFMSSGNASISFELGSSLESSISDFAVSTNPFAMCYAQHQTLQRGDLGGGETRDFLGIGAQTLCSSSISGWI